MSLLNSSKLLPFGCKLNLWFISIVLIASLTACQSQSERRDYPGPKRQDNEIAVITIPQEFDVTFVNGKEYSKPMFTKETRIELLPGVNDIVMEYMIIWDIAYDQHMKVLSQPFLLHFEAVAGFRYQVSFDQPATLKEARAFAELPELKLLDATGAPVAAAELRYQSNTATLMAGFTQVKKEFAVSGTDSAAPSTAPATTQAGDNPKAMEMLQYWWQEAGTAQREAFKKWINQ